MTFEVPKPFLLQHGPQRPSLTVPFVWTSTLQSARTHWNKLDLEQRTRIFSQRLQRIRPRHHVKKTSGMHLHQGSPVDGTKNHVLGLYLPFGDGDFSPCASWPWGKKRSSLDDPNCWDQFDTLFQLQSVWRIHVFPRGPGSPSENG